MPWDLATVKRRLVKHLDREHLDIRSKQRLHQIEDLGMMNELPERWVQSVGVHDLMDKIASSRPPLAP